MSLGFREGGKWPVGLELRAREGPLATGDPASSGAGAELSVWSWQPAGGRCSLSQTATLRLTEEPQAPTRRDPGPRAHISSHNRVLPQPLCDLSKPDDPF